MRREQHKKSFKPQILLPPSRLPLFYRIIHNFFLLKTLSLLGGGESISPRTGLYSKMN